MDFHSGIEKESNNNERGETTMIYQKRDMHPVWAIAILAFAYWILLGGGFELIHNLTNSASSTLATIQKGANTYSNIGSIFQIQPEPRDVGSSMGNVAGSYFASHPAANVIDNRTGQPYDTSTPTNEPVADSSSANAANPNPYVPAPNPNVVVIPEPRPTATQEPAPTPAKYNIAPYQIRTAPYPDSNGVEYMAQCVYVPSIHKRSCLAPNAVMDSAAAKWLASMMLSGNIKGYDYTE
jgi:hypothetical protein